MARKIPKPKAEAETTIGAKLEQVAHAIADEVLKPLQDGESTIAFPDKVTAFKVLGNYYAMVQKLEPPNPEEGGKFNGWGKRLGNGREQTEGTGARGGAGAVSDTGTDIEF